MSSVEIEVLGEQRQRNVSKFSQKVYNMIAQVQTNISEETENKKKLLQILLWINSVEIIYSFYLDYNTALVILRAVQLARILSNLTLSILFRTQKSNT
jgi:hypothetical protein